jgi:hypothetical protein
MYSAPSSSGYSTPYPSSYTAPATSSRNPYPAEYTVEARPAAAPADRQPVLNTMQRSTAAPQRNAQAAFGTLVVRVRPGDAAIAVDGESWDRAVGADGVSIDLAEGPHQIEIRRSGYGVYARTIDIRGGRPYMLNVSLSRDGYQAR